MHAAVRFELEQQLLGSYQQVKSLAESDALTGLANRYHFDKNLKATINNNHRKNTKVALVLFDLDHFKNINDNFGHDIGDLLLKRVVTRITSCLRGGEHFSRLGGDEFAITLSNINNPTQASSVARRIITVLQKPFDIENNVITTGASIGISLFPDNGLTSETLFKYADIAMYRAKRKGRGQACFFEDEMQRQFLLRIEIETSLRTVVSNNQLILHYQPVINLSNNEVEGFEALIRWQDKGSLRMPDEFIKIAEETHLIIEIGEWVINEALSTLAKWNETQTIPFRMAINVSPVQLCEVRLVNYIQYCLSTYNIPAHLIDIEITETALFKVESQAKQVIQSIHKLGCKLLLDDFGTGYSSISHLSNFPISGLKIDKSIIPESEYDVKNIKLTHCLSAMAKTMGLSVIAEGIDSEFKATICKKFSIDIVQGYLYSKPKSKQDIEKEHLNPDNKKISMVTKNEICAIPNYFKTKPL